MALVAVMVLLMILGIAISAMSVSGRTEITIARRHESAAMARAAAEAGLNHAIEVAITNLNRWEINGIPTTSAAVTAMLVGPDGLSGTVGADADNGSLEAVGIPRPPARLTLAGTTPTQYDARIFDEDDPLRGTVLTAADIASTRNTVPRRNMERADVPDSCRSTWAGHIVPRVIEFRRRDR